MRSLFALIILLSLPFSQTVAKNAAEKWPSDSIYQIQSSWKNQNGEEVKLKSFAGEKIIIGMVYTKCPNACPMTIAKIKEIERALKDSKTQFKVVLASFDPEEDTPKHLKKYMQKSKLDEKKWVFLSAPNDATARELAVVLGINYKPIVGGDFSHSNILTVLDKKGTPLQKIESLSADVDPLVKALKK